jgi:tRNA (guanine-N1)-methyltransferase
MWVGVISLFPEMFRSVTDFGVTGQAVKKGLLSIETWNPRDFTHDKHRTVDDRPYGGGPGMLMMVQPLRDAIHTAKKPHRVRRKSFTSLLKVENSTRPELKNWQQMRIYFLSVAAMKG